jgi:hypothetical protein
MHGFEWTSHGSNRKKFGCGLNVLASRIRPEQFLENNCQAQSNLDVLGLDHDAVDNSFEEMAAFGAGRGFQLLTISAARSTTAA